MILKIWIFIIFKFWWILKFCMTLLHQIFSFLKAQIDILSSLACKWCQTRSIYGVSKELNWLTNGGRVLDKGRFFWKMWILWKISSFQNLMDFEISKFCIWICFIRYYQIGRLGSLNDLHQWTAGGKLVFLKVFLKI